MQSKGYRVANGSQKFHRFIGKAHKWIGLILGLQILAWTAGGMVMTWLPIEKVRGEHKIAKHEPVPVAAQSAFLTVEALSTLAGQGVQKLSIEMLLDEPVAKLTLADDSHMIRHAVTGALISPISAELAQAIAEADFAPEVAVASVRSLESNNIDYRGALPVWQVEFADDEGSRIYVSPTEARVVARRSPTWRLFDFFWMLHIMDYSDRDDFNHPLVIAFASSAFLFTLSGLCLIFFRFYRRDFNFLLGKRNSDA